MVPIDALEEVYPDFLHLVTPDAVGDSDPRHAVKILLQECFTKISHRRPRNLAVREKQGAVAGDRQGRVQLMRSIPQLHELLSRTSPVFWF